LSLGAPYEAIYFYIISTSHEALKPSFIIATSLEATEPAIFYIIAMSLEATKPAIF
jgi:hypothetical protein